MTIDISYRYEEQAKILPLVSSVTDPKEGQRAKTLQGVIYVWRNGQWHYA